MWDDRDRMRVMVCLQLWSVEFGGDMRIYPSVRYNLDIASAWIWVSSSRILTEENEAVVGAPT
ncbi:hypothetical protein BDV59DRAFT_170736 [Aspergillus ambiguus]|uniref:uncharacterized protein n=1 Tax=Aspergillus ambiguus TaxID=176160 RepID=UPI003CCDE463